MANDGLDFSTGSAKSIFAEYLGQIGINADGAFIDAAFAQWNNVRGNRDEFLLWLRGTDTYKARFPYAADLRARGVPFSEAGAIQYERNVRQLLHSVGAPDAFMTQDYLNKLIQGDVSYNELESRVANNYADYLNAPEVVKAEFRAQVGDDSALLAYYLDPQHTLQNFNDIKAKALVRGYGKQFGLNLGDNAAQYAYGLSGQQVQQGLAQTKELGALTRGTVGEPGALTQDQLAQDVFSGDTTAVRRLVEQRTAEFSDAGGPATGQQRTGFGAARGA